ncbi:hypothetical protein FJ976_03560 [Mesorhizobium sp. B1-1-9]|nr:hypothetical protein FJ978_01650 [Mesorhizobium sp. B1-1-7]TPN57935.1 hypothetical protein FJ976_03560 [Mesorhizobium sp. B1-1-9]
MCGHHVSAGRALRRSHGRDPSSSSPRRQDGTGMGPQVARSIIGSHGGRMWAIGSHGRGATFHLSLPFAISGHD